MNISALPELLVNWFKNQGTDLLQAGKDQPATQTGFKQGQQYDGQVLQNLANGRSLVKVGQDTLDMHLPKEMRPGETVRLTYLNNAPRPTFMLAQPAAAAAPTVRLSGVAQQVAALVRIAQNLPPTPGPAASSATVSLTAAGTPPPLMSSVPAAQAPLPAAPAPAVQPASPAAMSPALPPAVQASSPAVQTMAAASLPSAQTPTATAPASGRATAPPAQPVATTINGTRPLVTNPAVMLAANAAPASVSAAVAGRVAIPAMVMTGQAVEGMRAAMAAGTSLSAQGVTQAPSPDSSSLPVRLKQVVQESGMFYESHLSRWTRGELSLEAIQREPQARFTRVEGAPPGAPELRGMSDDAARMAGRQLIILEGAPFVWQGQPWPGQQMEWLVEEREGEGNGPDGSPSQWHTELRLVLPRMGEISAMLDLSATGLQVRLQAQEAGSLDEIRSALPDLMARMRAAQLNVQNLVADLAHDGPEPPA